jgi:ribonuclease Z
MTLRVTFLGTGGAVPTTERNASAVFVNREGDQLLFDAGEGTQRQMMRFGTGFAVSDLFVTHTHGDHVLGIPGLIQTWNFNDRTAPLTVYAPEGARSGVRELIHAVDTTPGFPVEVRTVAPGDTVLDRPEYRVEAVRVDHRTRAVGYALVEAERKGRFDRERAEALGVEPGPKFSRLHDGEAVEAADGTTVRPEQVVGDPRPGRRVVYTGDTRPVRTVTEAAADADLLVHDGTFASDEAERAVETGHSTAREAGEVAAAAGAKRLALTHVSSRYAGDASLLLSEAEQPFPGEVVVARDGLELEIPYPDAEA